MNEELIYPISGSEAPPTPQPPTNQPASVEPKDCYDLWRYLCQTATTHSLLHPSPAALGMTSLTDPAAKPTPVPTPSDPRAISFGFLEPKPVPRTQKADGLVAAGLFYPTTPLLALIDVRATDQRIEEEGGEALAQMLTSNPFARPCPMRPRHGFVESRRVSDMGALLQVVRETREADPEGEVILVKYVESEFSGVLTPGLLVLGEGNDGATQGRGAASLSVSSGIRIYHQGTADAAYIEFVAHRYGSPIVTQIRGGPAQPGKQDFVPNRLKVKAVVEVDNTMSLLEWEAVVARFKPGTVVYHPGGSAASHYGVHCVVRGVPYLTTHRPVVGRMVTPTRGRGRVPLQEVLKGIRLGDGAPVLRLWKNSEVWKTPARFVLFALHNYAWLIRSKLGAQLMGVALNFATRLSIMAIAGEARHKTRPMPERAAVHGHAWRDPMPHVKQIYAYWYLFTTKQWRTGYGGPRWAACANSTRRLTNALIGFSQRPTAKGYAEAIYALNEVVNVAHNNGKFLSKFLSNVDFDAAVYGDSIWIITRLAKPLWNILEALLGSQVQEELLLDVAPVWGLQKKVRPLILPQRRPRTKKAGPLIPEVEEEEEPADVADETAEPEEEGKEETPQAWWTGRIMGTGDVVMLRYGSPIKIGIHILSTTRQPTDTSTPIAAISAAGGTPMRVVRAQAVVNGETLHIQASVKGVVGYAKFDLPMVALPTGSAQTLDLCERSDSMAGSGRSYGVLGVDDNRIMLGQSVLLVVA